MSRKASGLGRGLDALIPRAPAAAPTTLPLDRLAPSPRQPRATFDDAALEELAASIREKGLLQPLLVRPAGEGYEVVAGERRWRAARLAGLASVPVVVREIDERETLELGLVENLQREDLSPLEEARAYARLIEMGRTQEEAAKVVGKGRSTVANALRLLALPARALEALEAGRITPGHARAILALPGERRDAALDLILASELSVREAEALAGAPEPARPAPSPPARPRPHRNLELELSRLAGTRVRIVGQDKGKLELAYGSVEELGRLLELLGYRG